MSWSFMGQPVWQEDFKDGAAKLSVGKKKHWLVQSRQLRGVKRTHSTVAPLSGESSRDNSSRTGLTIYASVASADMQTAPSGSRVRQLVAGAARPRLKHQRRAVERGALASEREALDLFPPTSRRARSPAAGRARRGRVALDLADVIHVVVNPVAVPGQGGVASATAAPVGLDLRG